mmetsp:Transcript_37224/g.80947  ORF Transcript_37224/g.80947 Transcript_37224/m.80947 type:complete len:232 (-) Transcript_37224:325-1020(-)
MLTVDQAARDAGGGGRSGGEDLGGHASSAHATAFGAGVHLQGPGLVHHSKGLRVGVRARVGGVQVVHVGAQKQAVSLQLDSSQGGQVVVVAEPHLGRVCAVVFVDDRNDAERETLLDGGLDALPVVLVQKVALVKKQLCDLHVQGTKEILVDANEVALSSRRHGLLRSNGSGSLCQVQLDAAHTDGARGDEDDLVAVPTQGPDGVHQSGQVSQVDAEACLVRKHQGGCAHL